MSHTIYFEPLWGLLCLLCTHMIELVLHFIMISLDVTILLATANIYNTHDRLLTSSVHCEVLVMIHGTEFYTSLSSFFFNILYRRYLCSDDNTLTRPR